MSWFDASGLTSLAKSALKEAQKTIDKALDIQHEEENKNSTTKKSNTDPTPTPSKDNADFFSSWGLTSSDSLANPTTEPKVAVITQSPAKAAPHSIWGSFTGSFFETELDVEKDKADAEIIKDDFNESGIEEESFSKSKLVMHGLSEDSEGSTYSRLNSETDRESIIETSKSLPESVCEEPFENMKSDHNSTVKGLGDGHPVILRRSSDQKLNCSHLNRLSIVSSGSGKNSSESIEVLNSQSMKTTPDSDGPSVSMGLKLASSSVEILPDSLMTPSSVELLGFSTSGGSRTPDDEFLSPMTSPTDLKNNCSDEDIKILNETRLNEEEENSVAEDTISYNSISEFTAPTVLDAALKGKEFGCKKVAGHFSTDLLESFGSDSSSGLPSIDNVPITRAPSRNIVPFTTHTHLQYETPKHFSEVFSSSGLEKSMTESSDVISVQPSHPSSVSLISDSYASSNEGSWSDRTLNADSEGVAMESSTDEKLLKTSAVEKDASSFYIKGLLEDAITDKISERSNMLYCKIPNDAESLSTSWKDSIHSGSSQSYEEVTKATCVERVEGETASNVEFTTREQNSPASSESLRSGDIVKVSSEQTSGHTSGDDLETTTSSDIEIIPSPNGDYGSIYSLSSRQSPAKLPNKFAKQSGSVIDLVLGKGIVSKIRGHNRELSETSSQSNTSDDSHCSETEKLTRRLSEMADVLECREAKLIEISRNNIELTESNAELKATIESLQGKQETGDVMLITEEYTQRMSALEKKFQQAIREKDTLRKQVETYKQEAANRMTSGELEKAIGERDETIKELREEGEKLSKQQLHHTTIIKRLRTKERENEQVIKTLRDRVAEQSQDLDRMKRSISAKELVECSQIEAVYKLTTANKKLEAEIADTKSLLDDTTQKLETMLTSLDAAKKELLDLHKNSGDLAKRQETLQNVEREKASMEAENEQLLIQLDELRIKLRQDEQRWMNRETSLRSEVSRQMARAEEAESILQSSGGAACIGEGKQDGSMDDAGLLTQLAALQDSSAERERRAHARERQLQQIINETQNKLTKTSEANQTLREECQGLRSKVNSLETSLGHVTLKLDNSSTTCQENMVQLQITMETHERLKQEFDGFKRETGYTTSQLHERIRSLDQYLSVEKAACEAEKRRNAILQEQLREANHALNDPGAPSMLLARLVGDSNASNNGLNQSSMMQDRNDQAPSPHGSVGRESLASDSIASGMWHLDDGEFSMNPGGSDTGGSSGTGLVALEQLQSALQRREGELRAARRATRASHAQRAALARELAAHAAELDTMQSLQHQYDALLQMYGEKEEQLEELRLDLQDVKDMYKMQLDEILMLKRQAAEHQNAN